MTLDHHPGEAWLLDYSLGHLPELFDAVLRAHIDVCAQCRANVAFAERLGGEMLATLTPRVAVPEVRYREICDNYEQVGSAAGSVSRVRDSAHDGDIEDIVQTYLNSSLDALRWRHIGKGLRLCRLAEGDGSRMWMLRGDAGVVLPAHTHSGSELTLVLKGAYFCGSNIFRAGDIEDADESTEHQPVITRDGECICLAVTEGALRFRGLLPRLAQPFIGI